MLDLVLSTYIRPVTISDSWEIKQPAVIDQYPAGNCLEDICGYNSIHQDDGMILRSRGKSKGDMAGKYP